MPLCREAVFGPAFTPGLESGNPERPRSAFRLAAKGGETEGGAKKTSHASQLTRPKGRG
jgi:hypothetical protein